MTETLSKAWALFDAGNYTDAETIYKECYAKIPSTDHDNYWQVLMGLIYVESFQEHFAEARTYASHPAIFRCVCPHCCIASMIGASVLPKSVILYSVFGGTTG